VFAEDADGAVGAHGVLEELLQRVGVPFGELGERLAEDASPAEEETPRSPLRLAVGNRQRPAALTGPRLSVHSL
jgi:hypothetical protein